MRIKDKTDNWKPLREYTDQELYEFLELNQVKDAAVLACICSEILRRKMKDEFKETS